MAHRAQPWVFVAAAALMAAGAAHAQAPVMPTGARTLAPAGFIAFCRQQPAQCQGAPAPALLSRNETAVPPPVTAAVEPSRPAPSSSRPPLASQPRRNWRLAPTGQAAAPLSASAMSAVPTPVVLAPSAPSQITVAPAVVQWSPAVDDLRDIAKFTPTVAPEASDRLQAKAALLRALAAKRYDAKTLDPGRWSRGPQSAVTAPFPLPVAPRPEPRAPMTASPAPVPPNLGAPRLDAQVATMDLLTQVNRSLNRRIGRNSDAALYGREDVWTIPTGDRAQGDCEDYVLAKRQALIEAGVSADALSIAVVRTRRGEGHAVLLARTAEGEYVLDNLSPWVVPWTETSYEWVSRQGPGAGRPWVQIDTPRTHPRPASRPTVARLTGVDGRPIVIRLAAG